MYTPSGKARKGSVSIESFRGRLRLRLPRQLFNSKQKYLYTELADTDINRKAAEAKVKLIEADIALERCNTSTQMIDQSHADKLKLAHLRPED